MPIPPNPSQSNPPNLVKRIVTEETFTTPIDDFDGPDDLDGGDDGDDSDESPRRGGRR